MSRVSIGRVVLYQAGAPPAAPRFRADIKPAIVLHVHPPLSATSLPTVDLQIFGTDHDYQQRRMGCPQYVPANEADVENMPYDCWCWPP